MKSKVILLIDGENISASHGEQILSIGHRLGTIVACKVYHRQKDPVTRRWTEQSRGGRYKDICLFGPPAKDKVDRKMQKDARAYLKKPDIDMVCVATSDGGFHSLAEDAATAGKGLCFIGGQRASQRLRNAPARFIELADGVDQVSPNG